MEFLQFVDKLIKNGKMKVKSSNFFFSVDFIEVDELAFEVILEIEFKFENVNVKEVKTYKVDDFDRIDLYIFQNETIEIDIYCDEIICTQSEDIGEIPIETSNSIVGDRIEKLMSEDVIYYKLNYF